MSIGATLLDMGFWILNDIVWIKNNPLPQMKGVRFCNAYETLLWVKKSREQTKYTFHYRGLKGGNEDRQMRSDWHMPICSGAERITANGSKAHATQKPEALLHRIIVSSSKPGDVVLDPFCGTGTTASVAKRLNRRFIAMDGDERYVEIARRRVAAVTPADPSEEEAWPDAPKRRVPFLYVVESGLLPAGSTLWLKSETQQTAAVHEDGSLLKRVRRVTDRVDGPHVVHGLAHRRNHRRPASAVPTIPFTSEWPASPTIKS